MKLKILLTFDYELYFLNNNVSESKVLFEPTKKLLELAKRKKVKLIFFIDIVSIIAYKNNNQNKYINNFKEQINIIKELGHDIQMHFHPHWRDSIYNKTTEKWNHKYDNWSYSNLIDNFGVIKANEIFKEAHDLFIEVVGDKPLAFRAGGYTIQPNQTELINILTKLDYKYDSSVVPYKRFISSAQIFDFLKCEDLNYWNIDQESFLRKGKLKLFEIPMLSIKKNIINIPKYAIIKLINKFITNPKFLKRGKGATAKAKEDNNNSLSFSFDMTSNKDKKVIEFVTKTYIQKFKNNDIIYLNILSHPKAIFNESLNVMEWYIDYMNKKYNCEFIGFDNLGDLNER